MRSKAGSTWAALIMAAVCMNAGLVACELVSFPITKRTAVDRTSFIVSFDESIGEPVAVAAIASLEADPETIRSAAASQERAAALAAERIIADARNAGINVLHGETFGHVMTGISLKVATEEDGVRLAELLKQDVTVKAVHPVVRLQFPTSRLQPADVQAAEAVAAATATAAADPAFNTEPAVWGGADKSTLVDMAQLKYSGAGIKVAVIDDGLDYTHPAFGGCTAINTGANCRVIAGHDFTDGDSITYDKCGSHGTHVAGIIAGDTTGGVSKTVPWRGVAYKASLGAYRVFGCDGGTTNEWLLAALERAVKDGMTVINLSIGTSWTAPLGVEFTTRLAKQGVMVAAAAGNSGNDGLWTYGAPASEPDSVSVGSTDNTYSLGAELLIDSTIKVRGDNTRTLGATARALMQNRMPKVSSNLALPQPRDACGPIQNKGAINGKIAVVSSGTCTENEKAINLLAAGAESVLFYDNRPYPAFKQAMNIDEGAGNNAPQMFCVDQDTGLALVKALEQGRAIKVTSISTKRFLNPNAEKPSWFSSWGPDVEMRMLPTFSAPGGGILSSIPGNNFAEYQGTSMATPYATGALALWSHANKKSLGNGRAVLDAAKADFINTAMPIKVKDSDKFMHSVVVAGAGLIQVKSAIDNTVEVRPSYLSLPTGQDSTTTTVTLSNTGKKPVAYRLGHSPAVAISTDNAWYEQEEQDKLSAIVKFRNNANTKDINTITIAPGQDAVFKAIISTTDRLRAKPLFFSGYLSLTPIDPAKAAAVEAEAEAAAASTPGRRMLQDSVAAAATEVAAADPAAANAEQDFWFPPLSIPYLSLSQKYSDLSVVANPRADVPEGRLLVTKKAYLCSLMDGSCAVNDDTELPVDALTLQLGVVTFALPLARPVQSAYIEVYNANRNTLMGRTDILEGPLAWGGPKTLMQLPEMVSGAYYQGEYLPNGSSGKATARLPTGRYKFKIVVQKPVAIADKQPGARVDTNDYTERVDVLGTLVVGSGMGSGFGR